MSEEVEIASKTCNNCGEHKPLAEFHRRRAARDGRQSECAVCARVRVDESRSRRIARIGIEGERKRARENVQRYRSKPTGRARARFDSKVQREAYARLRDAHRKEYDALLAIVRDEMERAR